MFHPPSCCHHCMFPLWTRTWWRGWTVSCVVTAQRASRVFASNCCCVWWRWDQTSVCLLGFLCQVILDAPDDARQSCCFSSAWTRSAGHACGKESTRLRVRGPWWSGPGPPEESRLRWNSSGGVEARGVSPSHTLSDTLPGNHESHWRRYVCPSTVFRAADKLSDPWGDFSCWLHPQPWSPHLHSQMFVPTGINVSTCLPVPLTYQQTMDWGLLAWNRDLISMRLFRSNLN